MRFLRSIAGILAAVMFMLSAVSGLSFAGDIIITDEEIDPETGLAFTLLEDGTYSVSCPDINREALKGDIIIPGTFKNKAVTEVGEYGFEGCSNIESVTISNGVKKIRNEAFLDCDTLKSVSVPASVISFDIEYNFTYVFRGCTSLAEILVDDKNTKFCSVGGTLFTKDKTVLLKYPSGKINENYIVPNTVKTIGGAAFNECNNLKTVTMGNNVNTISTFAFQDCLNLETIYLSASVNYIYSETVIGCKTLKNIEVSGENNTFCSENGVLLSKDKTSLMIYPAGKTENTYNIPKSVSTIWNSAFQECAFLKSIIIPSNVTNIRGYAFDGCESLENIHISAGVQEIGSDVFRSCRKLLSITVDEENVSYCAVDGLLFSKNMENLLIYPEGKSDTVYAIPEGVKKIVPIYNDNLEKLIFPHSLEVPPYMSSWYRNKLKLEYNGTVEEWNNLIIGAADYIKESYNNYVVICSDGKIGATTPETPHIFEKAPISGLKDDGSFGFVAGISKDTADMINNLTESQIEEYKAVLPNITVEASAESGFNTTISLYVTPWDTMPSGFKTGMALDLTFKNTNEEVVQPLVPVVVTIPVPESLKDKAPIFVYHIGDDGKITKVETKTETVGEIRCVVFETSSFSTYVLSKEKVGETGDPQTEDELVKLLKFTQLDDGTYSVECPKENRDKLTGDLIIPTDINGSKITVIGEYAFYECKNLISVMLPESITTIGSCAFYDCNNLACVKLPNNLTTIDVSAFARCTNLVNITLPESLIAIKDYAFTECDSITSVVIPQNVESITNGAFSSCKKLFAINVDESNKYFCSEEGILFNKDKTELVAYPYAKKVEKYKVPKSVTKIGQWAFANHEELISIDLHNGITDIGWQAFAGCKKLNCITIPESVTNIGEAAFEECESLTSVIIGNGITQVKDLTFFNCTNLTSVILPETVTYIMDDAFLKCHNLSSIDIPNSVTRIGAGAFSECGLVYVKLPNGISEIASYVFYGCEKLKSVSIPTSIREIKENAFLGTKVADIYYEGSESQWGKIKIDDDNSILSSAIIHYNSTDSSDDPSNDTSDNTSSDTSEPTSSDTSDDTSSDTSSNISGDTSDDTSSDTSNDTSSDTNNDTSNNGTSTSTGNGESTKDVQIGDGAPNAEIVTPMGALLDAVLTAEELEQYKNGADIKITVTSNNISRTVTSSDMDAVKSALSDFFGYNVGLYVDMRIFKSVSGKTSAVHDLNSPITVKIDVPENLRKIGREFIVVRVHDGKATVLNDYDENDNTITFRTDKFSTYAIAYKDKSGTTGSVSVDSNDNPYTGGNSNQIHFLVIGCVSLFVFVLLCLFIGKNGMTEEEKERKFSKIIAWGKKGGKVRAAVALTVIFLLLSFYYGIGMKTSEK